MKTPRKEAYVLVALILAASPDPRIRDGKRAFQYSQLASELSGSKADPLNWQATAAAYAEIGDFDRAVTSQEKAIDASSSKGSEMKAARFAAPIRDFGKPKCDLLPLRTHTARSGSFFVSKTANYMSIYVRFSVALNVRD
jgi:hypothetical protein